MNTKARQALAVARLIARERAPYFRSALLALVPREMPGLNTLGVSRAGILYYDPETILAWDHKQLATGLEHEIGHWVRKHADRADRLGIVEGEYTDAKGKARAELWNTAADFEINDDLVRAKREFPHGYGALPKDAGLPDGRTAEEYFRELEKQAAAQPKTNPPGGAGGAAGAGRKKVDPSSAGGPPVAGPGAPPSGPSVGNGWCGSVAGRAIPGEDPNDKAARSEADVERICKQVAEDVRSHAKSKGIGTVPANLLRWAEETLKPAKIPWRSKLARAARRAIAFRPGAVDYRYNRISRRQAGLGFGPGRPVLPALVQPVPQIEVWVDTSGSMGAEELGAGLSEIRGVMDAVGATVQFGALDAAVHEFRPVKTWKDILPLLKGGGGTDFRPAFAAKRRVQPDVMIFVTDGCGPAPEVAPPYKVIWLLVGRYRQIPAAWGEVIEIDDDGATAKRAA